ncbi:rifin [Plasmodium falciparum RAJ116]|uniref:Rifin n=1 Tax=Plasmodium falciparum RAJ116 TaxID=580058 RepID=A0A0L0CZE8_PLAFA|nr:rifin [Plasmodium falciparum RAJ116]
MPNYDNDPEMKSVMQQFHDRTKQRFQEYDEMLQEKRQICKDTCDKEIQKIILKDKLEKELTEKFSSLHTDIQSDDIPTCICEKSLADKVEKGCLRCGSILGAAMPEVGSIGATALYTLCQWQTKAIAAATEYALAEGAAKGAVAGEAAGKNAIIGALKTYFHIDNLNGTLLQSFFNSTPYTDVPTIATAIDTEMNTSCSSTLAKSGYESFCALRETFKKFATSGKPPVDQKTAITKGVTEVVGKATQTAEAKAAQVSSETSSKILTKQTDVINTIYMSNQTAIIASIIAIIIIVSIMVIIYLILRYRRKKKMKKKTPIYKIY